MAQFPSIQEKLTLELSSRRAGGEMIRKCVALRRVGALDAQDRARGQRSVRKLLQEDLLRLRRQPEYRSDRREEIDGVEVDGYVGKRKDGLQLEDRALSWAQRRRARRRRRGRRRRRWRGRQRRWWRSRAWRRRARWRVVRRWWLWRWWWRRVGRGRGRVWTGWRRRGRGRWWMWRGRWRRVG